MVLYESDLSIMYRLCFPFVGSVGPVPLGDSCSPFVRPSGAVRSWIVRKEIWIFFNRYQNIFAGNEVFITFSLDSLIFV